MKIVSYLLLAAAPFAMISAPAFAQSEEEEWEGAYVGGSFGLAAQNNDRRESVLFDTNRDGAFDDTVRTVTGANAFSPGFCGGAANGRTPIEGCRGDKDGLEYNIRAGYDVQQGQTSRRHKRLPILLPRTVHRLEPRPLQMALLQVTDN